MEEAKESYQDRKDIPEKYRWKLEDIYPAKELWENDFKAAPQYLEEITQYRGKVTASADNLYQTLQLKEKAMMLLERLAAYAMLHRDVNTADQHYQGLADRVTSLSVQADSALSFLMPEILELDPARLEELLAEKKELELYRHFLEDLQRQRAHFRSPAEEEIIALSGEIAQAPGTIYSLLTNADMEFPEIEVDGKHVRLTQGNYIDFLQNKDREVRRQAHEALYRTYASQSNTLGATYNSSIKADLFQARVRRYSSALEAALDPDNIPEKVYAQLLASVHRHLPAVHRYMELKRKELGAEQLRAYDLYVPLTAKSDWRPGIEEAQETVLDGLKVMGEDYDRVLAGGFASRWLDVYETKGKRSGAYSWGAYGVHPYVLLNYQPNLENVFTIAHEMGHALHSYYTNAAQPYIYSHYPIFLAEVASTVNEALLFRHLLDRAGEREKSSLLEKNLEQFRTTLFRQVLFAEFERKVHQLAEAGEPLTSGRFNEVYGELLQTYYGPALELDDYIKGEWARIPHFYSAFYVYKYATGFSAAVAFSQSLLHGGQEAHDRYLQFLKSGSSDYPLEILRRAGVDLATPQPVDAALEVFEQRLAEFAGVLAPAAV